MQKTKEKLPTTFEESINLIGLCPIEFYKLYSHLPSDEFAYKKLKIIIQSLNRGWTPCYNSNSEKWNNYFYMSPEFKLYGSYNYADVSFIGMNIVFKEKSLAEYTAKQFVDIYKEFYDYNPKNEYPINIIIPITSKEQIKTFEDALLRTDQTLEEFNNLSKGLRSDEIAYRKLKIIIKVLNNDWKPNHNDLTEYKYYPWHQLKAPFAFSGAHYGYMLTASTVGVRLCFKSRELSDYVGKQFEDIYKQFMCC